MKAEKREVRKDVKDSRDGSSDGEDPDIAGIVPGPQPLDPDLFGVDPFGDSEPLQKGH